MRPTSMVFAASLWVMSLAVNAQPSQLKSTTIEKSENGHSFVLRLAKKQFQRDRHDLSKINANIVDGRRVFGVDASIPREEFSEFTLTIDGDVVPISPQTFDRFYDPTFGYESGRKYVDAFWGDKYNCVFVYMNGSDGAGAYSVTWVLNRTGVHTFSLIPTYEMGFNFNDSR
jgi:hypothetical protein